MARQTLELLESLLVSRDMTPDQLDELLRGQVAEDVYLEYKHGKELDNRKEAAKTMREYMSAFANSAGGILIIGVDKANWMVTGYSAPGGGDVREWASRCLTPIAHHFSPLPDFCVVKHPEGDVLVAWTDRSVNLVPVMEKGQPVYYLRIHDQTLLAPEYLAADLLLGRRDHPYLHVTEFKLRSLLPKHESETGIYRVGFRPSLTVENEGLSWAEDVRIGIIGLASDVDHPRVGGYTRALSRHLLSHITIQEPDKGKHPGRYIVTHDVELVPKIEPFDLIVKEGFPRYLVLASMHNHWYTPYTWKAALYVIPRGAPPVWYQLSVRVDTTLLQLAVDRVDSVSDSNLLEIKRLSGERPVVAWDGLQ